MTTEQSFQERVIAAFGESTTINLDRLGSDQWSILRSMCEQGGWSKGSGWVWSNPSGTTKLSESLVKRGLLFREDRPDKYNRPNPRYTPNPDIAAIWQEIKKEQDRKNHARWAEQDRQQAIAALDRKAHDFAVAKLLVAHDVEYRGWANQFKADHPVES